MVLKTILDKELEKRVVPGFLVKPGLDWWLNHVINNIDISLYHLGCLMYHYIFSLVWLTDWEWGSNLPLLILIWNMDWLQIVFRKNYFSMKFVFKKDVFWLHLCFFEIVFSKDNFQQNFYKPKNNLLQKQHWLKFDKTLSNS